MKFAFAPAAEVAESSGGGHTETTLGKIDEVVLWPKGVLMPKIVAKGERDLPVPTGDGVRVPQNRRVQIVYGGGATS